MPYRDPEKRRAAARTGMKAHRDRKREAAAPPPPKAPRPVKDPAAALARWARRRLVVPAGHPLAGQPMALPAFAVAFLSEALRPGIREAALLVGRKNAKSAAVAVLLLGYLAEDGPLRRMGWRAGVASLNREKSGELWLQAREIAEASGLDGVDFWKVPRRMESRFGSVDFLSADKNAGQASGFDLALIDEIGLFDERGRPLVSGMLQSTAARDGRMIAISVRGDSPMVEELIERRGPGSQPAPARVGDPAVLVHLYEAPKGADLEDRTAWKAANPTLGRIKSLSYMVDASRKAKALPGERASFETYDLNRPTRPGQHLVCDPDKLAACELDRDRMPPRLGACWLGLDLGTTLSMNAATATWQNGRTEYLCQWGDEPPLDDRAKLDGVGPLYELAFDAGELLLSEGAEVDPRDFLGNVVRWLDGVRVLCCAFDTFKSGNVRAELSKEGLAWPLYQTMRHEGGKAHRSADINRFRLALQQQRVLFPRPNLLMTNAVARSHVHTDLYGLGELRKARSTARIDVLASTLLAVGARDSRPAPVDLDVEIVGQ